jgi:hypothetical protein
MGLSPVGCRTVPRGKPYPCPCADARGEPIPLAGSFRFRLRLSHKPVTFRCVYLRWDDPMSRAVRGFGRWDEILARARNRGKAPTSQVPKLFGPFARQPRLTAQARGRGEPSARIHATEQLRASDPRARLAAPIGCRLSQRGTPARAGRRPHRLADRIAGALLATPRGHAERRAASVRWCPTACPTGASPRWLSQIGPESCRGQPLQLAGPARAHVPEIRG